MGDTLDAAIARHARAAGKAPFPAHLTLASGPVAAAPDLARLAAHASMTLERDGVLATAHFTRVYALRFTATAALLALRRSAQALLGDPPDALGFTPHLSLTYGPIVDQRALDEMADRFRGPLAFDRVCAVTHGAVETQDDVRRWIIAPALHLTA
jgi:hypothetical protein